MEATKRFYEEILKEDGDVIIIIDEFIDGQMVTKMGKGNDLYLDEIYLLSSTCKFTGRIIIIGDNEILCNMRFIDGLPINDKYDITYGLDYTFPYEFYTRGLKDNPLHYSYEVRFIDESDYDPEFSRNGGKYRFWVTYDRVKDPVDGVSELWAKYYDCSAEFAYCTLCGQFGHVADDCGLECPEFITTDELIDLLRTHIIEHGVNNYDRKIFTVRYFDRDNYGRKEGEK